MLISTRTYHSPAGIITLIRVTNDRGASVTLSSLGAGIVTVKVPDRDGNIENVALSYDNPADYLNDGPCLGKIPGRYANRIARGKFSLEGKDYDLPVNNGPNHLHGGPDGFQNRIWDYELLPNGVRFTIKSEAGDAGYPAEVKAAAEYRWSEQNELSLSLSAESDAPTVINLTNHAYWNLDGADAGCALHHLLKIKAEKWLPTDETLIPTGELQDVAGTPMDFRSPKPVGLDLQQDFPALKYGKGYDNCWAIDGYEDGKMIEGAVELYSEKTGRRLIIDTDQPGVQIYSGNWLAGSPKNHKGESYHDYDGIAIEAQGWPDAPNRPALPSQLLTPGHPYHREIRFRFIS